MNQFLVSGTPHVRSKESVQSIMRDVIIALTPATLVGIFFFGLNSLLLVLVSIASAVFFEWAYQKVMKKTVTITDLSAVVTGLLLAMNLPPSTPLWMAAAGSAFAIIIAKQLFGGLGQNFINPALAGRAFLLISYPTAMTTWSAPVGFGADAVSMATPLSYLKDGVLPDESLFQLFIGQVSGCIGEVSAVALIAGGIYLIVRHVISWRIPVIYIGVVFILSMLLGRDGLGNVAVYELLVGGLMLGAFFMATDYASSPITTTGQIIYAVGCGLMTVLIRTFGGYPEGVSFAILIMNLFVPLIERFTEPKIFGALPKVKEAK